jgi:hypothetical protein
MFAEHPDFRRPDDPDARIWRYMDLPRFISLLDQSALYFPRVDQLGDPHEGSLPKRNVELREAEFLARTGGASQQWAPGLGGHSDLAKITARTSFVSCWNLAEHENAALWNVYGKAVAVTSTFASLRDSLQTDEDIFIGYVTYLDYRTEIMDSPASGLAPLVHKRRYFENEKELRAVVVHGSHWTGDLPDGSWAWNLEGDPRAGILVPVDLVGLVEGVHVAPDQPDWFKKVVQSVCDRYGLPREVESSSLDEAPHY